ncbi:MAG: hypothetical protein ACAI44_27475 [Candidatus Sericytochromatia bacterium]
MDASEELQNYAYFNFTLPGPLQASFAGDPVELAAARFSLAFAESGIVALTLLIKLTPEGLAQLAAHDLFVASAQEEGYDVYTMALRPELLERHGADLTRAVTPEDCLAVGQGLCLQLENYMDIETARFE